MHSGGVAFNEADVRRLRDETDDRDNESDGTLLVLENPVPDEVPLILSVDGLLAARGGCTPHAAVCVHGVEEKRYTAVPGVPELHVSGDKAILMRGDGEIEHTILVGDILSIHGQSGDVFVGARPILRNK